MTEWGQRITRVSTGAAFDTNTFMRSLGLSFLTLRLCPHRRGSLIGILFQGERVVELFLER